MRGRANKRKHDLPLYAYYRVSKGNTYCVFERHGFRRRLPMPDSPNFESEYASARIAAKVPMDTQFLTPDGSCFFAEMERSARGRARVAGREYTLPRGWMLETFHKQGGRCAITGEPLKKRQGVKRDPWAPSIDRKDSAEGYTPENCHVVAYAVNVAKNKFDTQTVVKVAAGLLRTYGWTKYAQITNRDSVSENTSDNRLAHD